MKSCKYVHTKLNNSSDDLYFDKFLQISLPYKKQFSWFDTIFYLKKLKQFFKHKTSVEQVFEWEQRISESLFRRLQISRRTMLAHPVYTRSHDILWTISILRVKRIRYDIKKAKKGKIRRYTVGKMPRILTRSGCNKARYYFVHHTNVECIFS